MSILKSWKIAVNEKLAMALREYSQETDKVNLFEMVFCYQNCSDPLWEKLLKFEAEGQEFSKILRSLKQFIQTVKGQNNFW